jgi:hypothetical protein
MMARSIKQASNRHQASSKAPPYKHKRMALPTQAANCPTSVEIIRKLGVIREIGRDARRAGCEKNTGVRNGLQNARQDLQAS